MENTISYYKLNNHIYLLIPYLLYNKGGFIYFILNEYFAQYFA